MLLTKVMWSFVSSDTHSSKIICSFWIIFSDKSENIITISTSCIKLYQCIFFHSSTHDNYSLGNFFKSPVFILQWNVFSFPYLHHFSFASNPLHQFSTTTLLHHFPFISSFSILHRKPLAHQEESKKAIIVVRCYFIKSTFNLLYVGPIS